MNISPNLAFGRREIFLGGTKSFRGRQNGYKGRQNGYKGRQINVRWWETNCWEYKSSRRGGGGNKPIRKTKKKWRHFFLFFETVKILYFVGAPFEFSGRAPFKLVTPLLHTSFFCCSYLCACLTARYFKVTTVNICKVIFPVPGLCSTFACAKMLYRRLVDDVTEIVVLLDTSYFPG